MIDPQKKAKLLWQCRRGMLELDLILQRFTQNHLESLSDKQIEAFSALLACTDPQLYALLMEHEEAETHEIAEIVSFIVSQH
jgi:antitoxin CptB